MSNMRKAWKAIEAPVMPPSCQFDRCFLVSRTAVPGEYLCGPDGWIAFFATPAEAQAEATYQNERWDEV